MSHPQACCDPNSSFCHAAKGTGYLFGASAASLTLVIIAATITAVAIGLLAWDGLFIYSATAQAPLNLLWAIPVTLAFIAIDLMIIGSVAKIGTVLGKHCLSAIKYCGEGMRTHFRAVCLRDRAAY